MPEAEASEASEITPEALAARVRPVLDVGLLAFDIDGVLAPLVEHADDSELLPGTHQSLEQLAERTEVAIVSGRSLESIERLFEFPPELHVIGSHGLEVRGAQPVELSDDERYRRAQIEILGQRAVSAAGEGAWLEHKPASMVLHTRAADDEVAIAAVEALINLIEMIDGVQIKRGHDVVEMLARTASKGSALTDLMEHTARSPLVYLGDDLTDEDVFKMMNGDGDISVRVGPGDTAARFRLAGPDAVVEFLDLL